MSFPIQQLMAFEGAVNRLASESVLAHPGRDEGLVPAYSLVGELRDLSVADPVLLPPLVKLHGALEHCLDQAQPFSTGLLHLLRHTVDWLGEAVECLREKRPVSPLVDSIVPVSAGEKCDVLMSFQVDENRELLTEFHAEVVDHLQKIEEALLQLDQQADDIDAVNSIFRSFHTIKGNAGFLGLVPMQTLAHEVESLLDLARNQKLKLNSEIITEILRSRDVLQALTQQVGSALESGHAPSSMIPVSHLVEAIRRLSTPGVATPVSIAPVSVAKTLNPAPITEPVAQVPVAPIPAPPVEPVQTAAAEKAASSGHTVRVNTEKLDSLMDVVGELVIVQSQILETTRGLAVDGSPLHRNVAQLSRITKELQHTSMSLRMIPIKQTFQKMERLARDLARSCVKKVQFVTAGEDTELDRTVVEEIADPLVHMVRNAMDHGLESEQQRVAAGKPELGTVHLSAYHQGSNIVIELRDDGRGMDPKIIYKKAVEKGVIVPNAVLTLEETYALIFAPGFSTAEKVTAVSGRGVGMDVVKRNIEKLRGSIEIESVLGQGSVFKIKLPLTMAIIDGLVVRVGKDKFILPATSVKMSLRPTRDSISTIHGTCEVIDLRGRLIPLHRLHRRFGIPADSENPWDGIVVIIEHSGKTSALLVDEMVSKQEVVIKNLGSFMQNMPGIAGGAILGDGNIALILDPASILQAA